MFWHQPKADPGMRLNKRLHFSIKLHIVSLGKGSEHFLYIWLYVHWWVWAKFPVHITQAIFNTETMLSSLCRIQMSVIFVLSDCCGFQSHQRHITFKRTAEMILHGTILKYMLILSPSQLIMVLKDQSSTGTFSSVIAVILCGGEAWLAADCKHNIVQQREEKDRCRLQSLCCDCNSFGVTGGKIKYRCQLSSIFSRCPGCYWLVITAQIFLWKK